MVFSVGPNKHTPPEHIRVDEYGCKYVKQNVIAFAGKCRVVIEGDEFWGGRESKPYRSAVLVNPTWRKILGCAEAAQKKTLDYHHDFLEGVYPVKTEGDVTILRLSLGS